ncbi:Homeobox protein MSX-2-like 1 [Homarus americanus]|uniref:Homeobox protein MSX-2-like 1 n=1 Tax=Homarus americanus TaxID=6706 RepID=A0A8J5MZT2_HOMAM|nr:Homeobox protein MSX-2-like 1 [Homarus americanus]
MVSGVKRREGGQKRKLGRNPRVPFSSSQLAALEARFRQSQYLSSCDVADLSALLNLTETRNPTGGVGEREEEGEEGRREGGREGDSVQSVTGGTIGAILKAVGDVTPIMAARLVDYLCGVCMG